jgi:hypothetical protein
MVSYQYKLLSFCWGVAVVFSFGASYGWLLDPTKFWLMVPLCASSVLLLSKIESKLLLHTTIILFLIAALYLLPALQNHRMVMVFSGLILLTGGIKGGNINWIVNNLRWLNLVVYTFAAFAKLNSNYLKDDFSCASIFLKQSLDLHGLGNFTLYLPSIFSLSGYWSLIVEIFLIFLLIPSRTRSFGIFTGVLFHICLATNHLKYFSNFSATMFLLLFSWLSEEQSRIFINRYLNRWKWAFVIGAATLFYTQQSRAFGSFTENDLLFSRYFIWSIFAFFILYSLSRILLQNRELGDKRSLITPNLPILSFAIINGLSLYLGIKTLSTFSMYSNIRIEPNYSNHLIISKSPDLFSYIADNVKVVDTTEMQLKYLTESETLRLPYIELCSYIARMDDLNDFLLDDEKVHSITYERDSRRYIAYRGGNLPLDCPGWFSRKFLRFSPVGDGSELRCSW